MTTSRKRPSPLSIRISEEQRQQLKADAAGGSVNAYVIRKLFGESAADSRKARRIPQVDQQALARLLGALGQSRLSQNMNQIARSANAGVLLTRPQWRSHPSCNHGVVPDGRLIWPEPPHGGGQICRDDRFGGWRLEA